METIINSNLWTDTGEHFVLFMDILGFKERVIRTPHNELFEKLKDFKERNKELMPLLQNKEEELLRMSQFSDSIIVVSRDADKRDLHRIARAAVVLMHNALEVGFAIKGAIAKGKVTFDKDNDIYFGLPIVDAYLLEEELKFLGVVFHYTVENSIRKILSSPVIRGKKELYTPINKYKIPLKTGNATHYCIEYHNLVRNLSKGDYSNRIKALLNNIEKTVSGNPRIYIENTMNFIDSRNKSITST